jgi:hypothetical protein
MSMFTSIYSHVAKTTKGNQNVINSVGPKVVPTIFLRHMILRIPLYLSHRPEIPYGRDCEDS